MEVKYSYGNKSGLPANITNGQVYVCKDDGTMYADLENKRYQIGGSYKGYFPELKVGYSDNMNGRREESSAEFIYRPSNGETSIETGLASIRAIKGNSVVWNQMAKSIQEMVDFRKSSYSYDEETKRLTMLISDNSNNIALNICASNGVKSEKGHIYALISQGSNDITNTTWFGIGGVYNPINSNIQFVTAQNSTSFFYYYPFGTTSVTIPVGSVAQIDEIKLIDLTRMFGAGNEPTTVEEFKALYPNIPLEYNEGEIRNMTASGIRTIGVNQWDEQWEEGGFNTTTGINNLGTNQIRAKTPFHILPNTQYYLKGTVFTWMMFYDENLKILEGVYVSSSKSGNASGINPNTIFTTPQGAYYMRFYTIHTYGNIYNNDICINLVHTGYNNGKYFPYWEDTLNLDIIQKYFSDGMKSAGNVCDEIRWNNNEQRWEAVQRVGVVDLGSLVWERELFGNVYAFSTNYNGISGFNNLLIGEYTNAGAVNASALLDKQFRGNNTTARIFIRDDSYSNAETFKASIQGVILNYELVEPIITPITEDVNFDYKVSDFGTEESLNTFVPFKANIIYGFNAVDTIRNNSIRISKIREELSDHLYWDKW